jgi:hypothetical protein
MCRRGSVGEVKQVQLVQCVYNIRVLVDIIKRRVPLTRRVR